jgi:hypothetical protein
MSTCIINSEITRTECSAPTPSKPFDLKTFWGDFKRINVIEKNWINFIDAAIELGLIQGISYGVITERYVLNPLIVFTFIGGQDYDVPYKVKDELPKSIFTESV